MIGFLLLMAGQVEAQPDSANYIFEAPVQYRAGQMYSNFVKIRLINNTVIPTTSHSQSIKGTSAIAKPSLKLIFDSHVLAASGDPANVVFARQNLDDYVHVTGAEEIFNVSLGVMMNIETLISDLRADLNIESVNPPYCIYVDGLPNNNLGLSGNPFAGWHTDRIQAPDAWVFMQPYATTPQTVAVVDGDNVGAQVYDGHPWLSGKIVNEPPVNSNCPTYGNHPTMVASCITAKECASSCNQAVGAGRNFVNVSSHGDLCGINNAFLEIWNMPVATRPKVINCSWVFLYGQSNPPFPPIGIAKFFNSYASINLNTVVLEQLIAAGTIVVASSGNGMSAPNACATSPYCFSLRGIGYPFGLPGVIGVGATSPNYSYKPGYEYGLGSGNDPSYYPIGSSSGGNWNYNYNNPLLTDPIDIANQNAGYLDITAPGDEIDVATYTGSPSSLTGAGTSFASPIVAAAAASMLLVNSSLTQSDVTRILTQTADKVNYNPNGMTLGDLNGSIPFTKGYTYSNTGNVSAGGFYDPTLDYVMGHGRLNMLSAVMNAAGLAAGGFTVTNSASFPVTNVVVRDVNDHSYLTGSAYNQDYEYDAIMNQNGSNLYFNSGAVSLKIDKDATFRIMSGARMNFTSGASLLLTTGTAGKGTKYVIGNGGKLALNDNTFNINGNAYLETAGTGSLTISNATVVVQSGGTLHIKSNAYLSLTSTGKIIVNSGGYVCVEPGATIVNNGTIDLTASLVVGVNPAVNTPPGSGCLAPCSIIANTSYSGSGSLTYTTCLAFAGNTVTNVSCLAANSGSIALNVIGGTLPYTYAWSNGGTTSSITGLAAGNYTATVTDAASNTLTAVFTVAPAATVTATVSSTNVFCIGGLNSGTATAGLLGGTAPYTYSWSTAPVQTTQTATGLAVGVYTVTVTDALGCAATKTVSVINDPVNSPMTISVSSSSVTCPGASNGSATVTVVGGNQTPGYTPYWSNSTGLVSLTPYASGLNGGNYTLTVVDASGCTKTTTFFLSQPAAFSSTVSMTPATSCTATTGSATVALTGGTPGYTYSWTTSPVQTASVATGLSVGMYSVTTTDSHSCTKTSTVMVANSSMVTSITSTNVSCYGFTDGVATATVLSGGTAPFTYQWSASAGYQTTQTVSNLGAGAYYVTITDALGNCSNALVNITAPTAIVSTSFVTSYFCNGAKIVTFPSGGTGPYTYSWSPGGQTTQTITGVSTPGYYSVVITDSHGCRSDAAPYYYGYATYVPVMPPLMITATYTAAAGSCTATNASASVSSIFNGSAPYSYSWSNGGTTQTITGLSVGVYSVQVTDANGCTATATINVTNSGGPALTESHVNATCSSSTGSATVTPIGGTAPYTYAWSGGQTTQSVSGLAIGTYSVLVTDANGKCNSILVTINPPTPMSFTLSKTNVSCSPGSDGTASVGSIFGGTGGPYTYSWSPGGQTTQTATGLSPGNYTVQVTDAGGCVKTGTINLPSPGISFYYGRTNVTCYGGNNGTAYVAGFYPGGAGTPPYTYLWMPGSQTTYSIGSLSAGNYTITVTDAGACTNSLVASIIQPNQIILSTTSSANTGGCSSPNGVASVAVSSGGTGPFSYLWNTVPAQTTPAATSLLGGVYTCTVTDVSGCKAIANVTVTGVSSITLTATASPTAVCAGSTATLTASGATSYTWQPGSLNTSTIAVTPGSTTVYTLTGVTGACSSTITKTLVVNALPSVSVTPTATTVCSGTSTSFTATGASTYSWTPGTGLSATTGSVVIATPGSTTIYTVTGTNAASCTAKATFTVTVNATPTVIVSPNPTTICVGSTATLTATGGTTYSWTPGTGLSATTGNTVAASPSVTTSYTVTGTTGSCTGSVSAQVIVSANTCTAAAFKITSPSSYSGIYNMGFGSPTSIAIMADITYISGTSNIACNDVRIAPGHQIIVKNGATLNITGSWLHSCTSCGNGMWSGIFVENGGHLSITGYNVIEDAMNAVSTQSYTSGTAVPDVQIQATIFNKNANAISMNLNSNPNNVQALGVSNIADNCVFTCRNLSSLSTPIPGSTNFNAVKSALYNNTGTYATTTTNAGVRSASGFSLTGAGTSTYPYVIGEAATTTTAGVGAINVYDYLDYGIWAKNSVFEVKNNFFQNLTGNNVSTPFGVGVYESTTSSNYPVSIGSSLTTAGANEGNVFKTCLRAVDLTGTDLVYIYNNTVNNAATSTYSNFVTTGSWSGQYGAFLKPPGTSTAVIHVEGNSISNCALGLHINRSTNYGGTGTTIQTNTITAGGTSSQYCNKGVFLEDATGCSSCMSSKTMQVLSNTITYAEDKAIHCSNIQSGLLIRCNNELSVTYKSVTNNTITTNSTNDVIRLDNCKNTYTEYNANIKTSGGNTSVANSNITGIFINNASATGNNNAVSFNTINYVGSCVVWEGDNSTAATFGYNQMKTGRHGLYMYTNAKFNNQGSSASPSGNRWGNPALTNHTYVDNGGYDYNVTTNIGKIYVLNGGVSGGLAPVPTVNSGSPAYNVGTTTAFGIIKISGSEATCPSCACDGGGSGGSGRPGGTESAETGELMYNTMQPAHIQQVLQLNERSEGLYAREQQWAGEKWAYGLIYADPSWSRDNSDLQAFYARMQNSNIARFTEAEQSINSGKFESAASAIQAIQPSNLQEDNLKQVYLIMLGMREHSERVTDADKLALWNIASQCEHTGGEAVVKARTLNNRLHNQAMVYADACLPNNNTLRQDNTATEAGILFNIYPNPGNGEVTVDYDGLNGQDATLNIYDVNGGLLHSTTLPASSKRIQLHAKDLANGVYMYKVASNTVTLKTGKIIILK